MSRPARPVVHVGVALLLLLSPGCLESGGADSEQGPAPIRVVDAVGTEHVLPEPARRVVSLVPSATETLRALGAVETLVGRTDFDTRAWTEAVPSVGGGIGPNLEAIVALEPDVVIRFAGEQDPRTPARLDALGIVHVAVRPDRVADILETALLLGRLTGRAEAADRLVAEIREGLEDVARRAAAESPKRVAYVLGGSPPWVSGPGTYIDEIVALAGGVNVFSDLEALYAAVSPEELLARTVDVVLTPGVEGLDPSLVPGARIEVVGPELEIPGPDVVTAAERVADLLHGSDLR